MVNYKTILTFLIGLFLNSCSDFKLIIPQTDNSSQKLKLNGYFYFIDKEDNDLCSIYFLYKNGTILYVGSKKNSDSKFISEYINSEVLNFDFNKSKTSWGLYQILNDKIKINKWEPTEGRFKTSNKEGQILNDSTFVITNYFSAFTQKEYTVNQVYHFRQFSPKPDSTNKFIK